MHNLNLAFDVAEKHLDIPKMLDAEGKNSLLNHFSAHSTRSIITSFLSP